MTKTEDEIAYDEADLEGLECPDECEPDDKPMKFDQDLERTICSAMITDKSWLEFCSHYIKPKDFTSKAHRTAAEVAIDYFKRYSEVPERAVLLAEFKSKVASDKAKLAHLGELTAMLDYFEPALHTKQYMQDQIEQFVKRRMIAQAYVDYIKGLEKGEDVLPDLFSKLDRVRQLRMGGGEKLVQTWDELKQIADTQKADWWLEGWAEFGSLVMLTGLPFSGKSSLVAELIACMARSLDFHQIPLVACPVVMFDMENKERILVKRVENALRGETGNIAQTLVRVNPSSIPRPLTHDFIETVIQQIEGTMKSGHGVVILDTMRSLFGGDELDVQEMVNLLYPLQRLAQKYSWVVLVIHHNAKSTGHYSGTTAIAGALDYLWNWQSDKTTLKATLSLEARDDPREPLHFQFDRDTGCNVFLGSSADIRGAEQESKDEKNLVEVLKHLSDTQDEAKTFKEITEASTLSLTKIKGLLTMAFNSQPPLVVREGKGTKYSPLGFWLTKEGSKLVGDRVGKEMVDAALSA